MLIRRILCAFAFGLVAVGASAQLAPSKPAAGPDPSTLTEAQISKAETPGPLSHLAAIYKEKGDYERLSWSLKRLTELLPNNGDLKLALATTYALRDEKTKAYDLLLSMQKQGYGYALAKDPNFDKISKTKVWPYILKGLDANMVIATLATFAITRGHNLGLIVAAIALGVIPTWLWGKKVAMTDMPRQATAKRCTKSARQPTTMGWWWSE